MISIVLATYNEEKNIGKCLQAVKDFADEIIIMDGSSTDQTVQIAKKFGAKVYDTTNKLNFHINKQMAMDKAKGELVLQMDADEVVDKQLASFIRKIHQDLKQNSDKYKQDPQTPKAWRIKRKNYFLNRFLKKGGQYPDPVIRLYINGFAKLPQQDVHEQMKVDGKIALAEGHLLHYSNPKFADYLRKFNHYTDLKAIQLKEEGITISIRYILSYLVLKPIITFLKLFIRHKGFVDGIAGFIFAFFSGLHHPVAYLKLWDLYKTKKYYD
jgi:glycosyltransferase involved in cell wall biosynthesis